MTYAVLGVMLLALVSCRSTPVQPMPADRNEPPNSAPSPFPIYRPFSGPVPLTDWTVTDEAVRFVSLPTAAFDFPRAPRSRNYLFKNVAYALTDSQTIVLEFKVTGAAPVFTFGVQDPSCTMPPMVTPFLWHGDSLATITDRYWAFEFKQLIGSGGEFSIAVPLTSTHWFDVYGGQSARQFEAARSRVNHLGVTFGGGCYYGHGVGLTSGAATFSLERAEILGSS